MTNRILVLVDPIDDIEPALRIVRAIASQGDSAIRLVTVLPVPEPARDRLDRIVVSADQRMDRLERSATDRLRAMAATWFDGVAVDTAVVFGGATAETGGEAETFGANLVVLATTRRATVRETWVALALRLRSALARRLVPVRRRASRAMHALSGAFASGDSPLFVDLALTLEGIARPRRPRRGPTRAAAGVRLVRVVMERPW